MPLVEEIKQAHDRGKSADSNSPDFLNDLKSHEKHPFMIFEGLKDTKALQDQA